MSTGEIVSREAWLAARKELLAQEKAHARAGAELAAARRRLGKVLVSEGYVFEGPGGPVSLAELFDGRSQLIVQHFMFGPEWREGCPSCSFWADGFDPMIVHMNARDVAFAAVSRGPVAAIEGYKKRMGWSFPWVSSLANSFNFDFGVSATDAERDAGEMQYNYAASAVRGDGELPGVSVFERSGDGAIYHTYSCYARGLDAMNAAYAYLDLTPKGRDEGELPFTQAWVRRHDSYD